MIVSIPHRYAENLGYYEHIPIEDMVFQSLIGMLKTIKDDATYIQPAEFQSLIGMLKTVVYVLGISRDEESFNPS